MRRDAIEEAEAPDVSERIAALCRHGVHVAVAGRRWDAGHDDHLRLHPAGPGTLHLLVAGDAVYARAAQGDIRVACVGADLPAMTAWLAVWLADRRIGGGLIVIVGAALTEVIRRDTAGAVDLGRATVVGVRERCGGPDRSAGPERHAREAAPSPTPGSGTEHTLLDVLDAQVRRRAAGRVPDVDHDPAWVLALPSPTHPIGVRDGGQPRTVDGVHDRRTGCERGEGGAHNRGVVVDDVKGVALGVDAHPVADLPLRQRVEAWRAGRQDAQPPAAGHVRAAQTRSDQRDLVGVDQSRARQVAHVRRDTVDPPLLVVECHGGVGARVVAHPERVSETAAQRRCPVAPAGRTGTAR